jgi:hypothetical protein
MLEEDEVALALAEHYVIEARRLLSDHLAKIARLKSEGKETSDAEQTLGLVEAFRYRAAHRFPSTTTEASLDVGPIAREVFHRPGPTRTPGACFIVKDRGAQALTVKLGSRPAQPVRLAANQQVFSTTDETAALQARLLIAPPFHEPT